MQASYAVAGTLCNLARIYCTVSEAKDSMTYFNQAQDIYQDLGDDYQLSKVKDGLGTITAFLEDFEKSEKYYLEALQIMRSWEDAEMETDILFNLSLIKLEEQKFGESQVYMEKVLSNYHKLNKPIGIVKANLQLGVICIERESINQEAFDYLENSLVLAYQLEDKYLEADAKFEIGRWYWLNDNASQAIDRFKEALIIYQKYNRPANLLSVHMNLGECFLSQGDTTSAWNACLKAFELYLDLHGQKEMASFFEWATIHPAKLTLEQIVELSSIAGKTDKELINIISP